MGTSKGLKSWEQHVQDEADKRSQSLLIRILDLILRQ